MSTCDCSICRAKRPTTPLNRVWRPQDEHSGDPRKWLVAALLVVAVAVLWAVLAS